MLTGAASGGSARRAAELVRASADLSGSGRVVMFRKLFPAILGLSVILAFLPFAPMPLTNAHDDPLPPGAAARIGTIRLRHGRSVSSVAFSLDGKRLASTDGHTVAVWDARTGRSLAFHFLPSQYLFWSPVVSPDGTLIACRLEDGRLGVQDTASGKQRFALPCKDGEIHGLAFSNDNRWLVSANEKGIVFLWDLPAGKLSRQWKSPTNPGRFDGRHAFTPDGATLVHSTRSGHILLWDVQTGKELFHIEPTEKDGYLYGLAVSPDGDLLARRDINGRIDLWQVKTGRFLNEIAAQPNECGPVFSPDGKQVICGNDHGEICFWGVAKAKITLRLKGTEEGYPASLAFSPDGKYLASGGEDHAVHLWDLAAEKELFPSENLGGDVSAAFLSDGKTLVSHCRYGAIRFWGTVDPRLGFWNLKGESLRQAKFDPGKAHALAITPDASTIAVAEGPHFGAYFRPVPNKYLRSSIRLCDLANGKELMKVENAPCQISHSGFSPDGRFLFLEAFNAGPNEDDYHRLDVVQVWKRTSPTTLDKIAELSCEGGAFYCAPDSQWVGVSSPPGWNFYQCETGKLLQGCPGLPGVVRAASPSGRLLACASDDDRTACVVERATCKPICKLECQPRNLLWPHFAVSPDGRIVASDLSSAAIVLWDAFTGKQIARLEGHHGDVCSLCFSPDGRYLVSGSSDTTILIWDYQTMLPKSAVAPVRHTPERLEQLWVDLQGGSAEHGYRAVWALVQTPDQAIALLRKKIPLPTADEQLRIQAWIDDLSNEKFAVRSRAGAELTRLGELAEPALRQALRQAPVLEDRLRIEAILDTSLGIPPGPWLARLRGFDALELINTPESRRLLEELSQGLAASPQTQEARRCMERQRKRLAAESK
jgi:WD40 repeat protein